MRSEVWQAREDGSGDGHREYGRCQDLGSLIRVNFTDYIIDLETEPSKIATGPA